MSNNQWIKNIKRTQACDYRFVIDFPVPMWISDDRLSAIAHAGFQNDKKHPP